MSWSRRSIPPRIIAGTGTIGLEILEQAPDVGAVYVPVSGGGLVSGVAAAIKQSRSDIRVIGVEPELANDAQQSLRKGERVSVPPAQTVRTMADGLRVSQVGEIPWAHIRAYVDDIVTVSEDQIADAMRRIASEARLIAEPSGAVAAAAALASGDDLNTYCRNRFRRQRGPEALRLDHRRLIMRAMQLRKVGEPLQEIELPPRALSEGEVRIQVSACAVCRTDLHLIDGELLDPKLPVTPGHEIIGTIAELGAGVSRFVIGDRVGVPWLGWACGICEFCRRGEENLCPSAKFTGYQIDGGYASETIADAGFMFPVPPNYSDEEAAPLMCAGLIGWRCLKAAGDGKRMGLYGFGAAAHIIAQVANAQQREVYAFVTPGDEQAKQFAKEMGACWAGNSTRPPPDPLDAAIIFAPVGALVPLALRAIRPGGTVVCGGIHMSDIPSFPYEILWGERVLRCVANLTRRDAEEFLAFAGAHKLHTKTTSYALGDADRALGDLREGRLSGAAVLVP